MSVSNLFSHRLAFPAGLYRRLPRTVRLGITYFVGAAILALILVAHRIPPFEAKEFIALFVVSLVGMSLSAFHLRAALPKSVGLQTSEKIVWTTIILALAGIQLGSQALSISVTQQPGVIFLAASPLVALAMLVSGMLGPVVAVFTVTLATLGAAIGQVLPPQVLAGAWITAAVAAHAVNPLRQRSNDLLRAIYLTGGVYTLVALSVALYSGFGLRELLLSGGWAAVAGIGATALFGLAIVVFERAFGVVSDWSLLELCSPDHPLLRKLVLTAPGTYAHSVMVGNLAEQAARDVGANGLLCKAMAYYHDIGKMKRPEFFIENRRFENPHDRLAPSLSASIISSHVRDGLELAEAYRLPKSIRDGIEQHHGTSLISYFYHKATKELDAPDPLLEQRFRYNHPLPRSKETAILMLADRVEASTRTLPRQTPGRLRAFIWEIVQDIRDDGQLNDSELHFRDLQTIVRSFVTTLGALQHERIEYPGVNLDVNEDSSSDINSETNANESKDDSSSPSPHTDA